MATDLSNLATGLSGGCSMGASNTISEQPWGGAVGSVSEASADIQRHDTPELDIGTPADHAHFESASAGLPPASYDWQYTQGSGR